jgi:membrane protein involved in colicin uptake
MTARKATTTTTTTKAKARAETKAKARAETKARAKAKAKAKTRATARECLGWGDGVNWAGRVGFGAKEAACCFWVCRSDRLVLIGGEV